MRSIAVAASFVVVLAGCGASLQEAATSLDFEVDDDDGSSEDTAAAANIDFDQDSSTGGTTDDPGSDDGGSASGSSDDESGPAAAGIEGEHDGVYAGTITIEFHNDYTNGTCTGEIEVVVDASSDPPITGSGTCSGSIAGIASDGATEFDGELVVAGSPSGALQFEVAGLPHMVQWTGTLAAGMFDGEFAGQGEIVGQLYTYDGTWSSTM